MHGGFRDGDRCLLCYCDLTSQQLFHQHEQGNRHRQNYQDYLAEQYRVEALSALSEDIGLEKLRRMSRADQIVRGVLRDPWFCGDLTFAKSALLDWVASGDGLAWEPHKQYVRKELIVLAVVKARLISGLGSVEAAREQCVLQEQAGGPRANLLWKQSLRAQAGAAETLVALVMPFVARG
jgi:hypothetical protein